MHLKSRDHTVNKNRFVLEKAFSKSADNYQLYKPIMTYTKKENKSLCFFLTLLFSIETKFRTKLLKISKHDFCKFVL